MTAEIDQLKKEIAEAAGITPELLTGKTAEENIAQAKALLAYKKKVEAQKAEQQTRTPAEQFEAWYNDLNGIEQKDTKAEALEAIAEAIRVDAGGYPIVKDGGQIDISNMPDARPAREQFAEWIGQQMAFNPFKDAGGWIKL